MVFEKSQKRMMLKWI